MGPSCSTRPIVPYVSSGITRTNSQVWWFAWRHGRAPGRPPHSEAVRPRILPAGPPRKAPTPEPRGQNAPAAHGVTVPELHECRLSNVDCPRPTRANRQPNATERQSQTPLLLFAHLANAPGGDESQTRNYPTALSRATGPTCTAASVASSACDPHTTLSVMTLFNYSASVRQSKPDPKEFQRGRRG